MTFKRVHIEDKKELELFLSSCGTSLLHFRYFAKRPLSVIGNHLVTLVGYENEFPCAYGHLDPDGSTVWLGVCVAEGRTGFGLGGQMVRKLIDEAIAARLNAIDLTVDSENVRAISLYKKLGFTLIESDDKSCHYRLDLHH